ncbi:MAG: DUF2851 family protein [Rikenellaceae bacterium]
MNTMQLLKVYAGSKQMIDKEFRTYDDKIVFIDEISNIDYINNMIVADAKLYMDNNDVYGRIVFIDSLDNWRRNTTYNLDKFDNTALILALDNEGLVCRINGTVIPSVKITPSQQMIDMLEHLLANAENYVCGKYIAELEDIEQVSLMTKLLIERIEMKCHDIDDLLEKTEYQWSETFYIMLVKMIGMGTNQKAYLRLAQRVPYSMISREKHEPLHVEALLMGAAGFLEDPMDNYQIRLANEFRHLQNKYSIRPLSRIEWQLGRSNNTRPSSHPVLRLAQISALVCSKDFLFDTAISCRSTEDLDKLFNVAASEYWDTHYTFGLATHKVPKFIGSETIKTLGINVVCFLMFRHGAYTLNQDIKDAALDLLEKIGVEKNTIITNWIKAGIKIDNAYTSQAMLQLYKVYCSQKQCGICQVCKKRINQIAG